MADNATPAGSMQFYDNLLPPLESGPYQATVTQTVTLQDSIDNDGNPFTNTYSTTQGFTVVGDRFVLAPGDVSSAYPTAGSFLDNSQTLPNLLLTQPTLPWQRNIDSESPIDPSIPWLALLVFDNDPPDNPAPTITNLPVSQLIAPGAGILGPSITSDLGDPDTCDTIDVDITTFMDLVPALNELAFLAHVREVNSADSAAGVTAGTFGVLIANKIPTPKIDSTVHLVSLEGFSSYLDPPTPPAGYTTIRLCTLYSWTFNSTAASPSFASAWNQLATQAANLCLQLRAQASGGIIDQFQASPPTVASGGSVEVSWVVQPGSTCTLDLGDGNEPQPVTSDPDTGAGSVAAQPSQAATLTLTAVPAGGGAPTLASVEIEVGLTPAQQTVMQAFAAGYVPLRHHTIEGEPAVDWYRGPLSPIVTYRELLPPYTAASQAMIYDPSTGMFDQSYAVAWTIGRLMALADGQFPVQLADWRSEGYRLVDLSMDRMDLFTQYDSVLTDLSATPAAPLDPESSPPPDSLPGSAPDPRGASKAAARAIVMALAPSGPEGEPRPSPPPRRPRVPAGMPGVLPADRIAALADQGGDPTGRVLDHLLGRSRAPEGPPA